MDYLQHMAVRLANQELFVPALFVQKRQLPAFAALIGVRVPEVYFIGPIRELLLADLPERFILKPMFASTSIGVHLLERADEGAYRSTVSGEVLDVETLIERCDAVSARFPKVRDTGSFVAEELLFDAHGGTPPPDVRAYSFQGKIGMFLVEHHIAGPAEAMFFDGDFLPFPDVHSRYGVAAGAQNLEKIVEAEVPPNWKALKVVAERVSTAVPTAFCRVDMYDTPKGVYLGEVTLYPGTFYYKNRKLMFPCESERLGRLWDDALARISDSIAPGPQAHWPIEE